jgi:hypothetical protein
LLLSLRAAAIATAISAAACSPSPGPTAIEGGACTTGFLGDASSPVDFEVQVLLPDDTVATIGDDASVPIRQPPQGGRVIFVGVRATNLDGCALVLAGALRDRANRQVRLDRRTINLTPTGDGWGQSVAAGQSISAAIADFSNIPVCPNQWSTTDIYGHTYDLEVSVTDRENRQLTKTLAVTPECAEPENRDECLCICRAAYVLGESCADGGFDG